MPVKLDSLVFNKAERTRAFTSLIVRSAKEFKQLTKDRMNFEQHTGVVYRRGRGRGFTRSHRASAVGERPAPDTTTLVNAVADRQVSNLESEVFIEDKINTSNGTVASKYASILQNKLRRPIMSDQDAAEAQAKLEQDALKLVASFSDNKAVK